VTATSVFPSGLAFGSPTQVSGNASLATWRGRSVVESLLAEVFYRFQNRFPVVHAAVGDSTLNALQVKRDQSSIARLLGGQSTLAQELTNEDYSGISGGSIDTANCYGPSVTTANYPGWGGRATFVQAEILVFGVRQPRKAMPVQRSR
jgi:hypothetical protein